MGVNTQGRTYCSNNRKSHIYLSTGSCSKINLSMLTLLCNLIFSLDQNNLIVCKLGSEDSQRSSSMYKQQFHNFKIQLSNQCCYALTLHRISYTKQQGNHSFSWQFSTICQFQITRSPIFTELLELSKLPQTFHFHKVTNKQLKLGTALNWHVFPCV